MSGIEVLPIPGLGEVAQGDPLGGELARAAFAAGHPLGSEDILVVSHKVVSKQEGRTVRLGDVAAGARATELARSLGKDPRMVELILGESESVIRAERGVLIVETLSGWICANAGVDLSNATGDDTAVLLPQDADASARRLREEIQAEAGARPAVVVADSFGRPWRAGQTDIAIGCTGLHPLDDWTDRTDAHGRPLTATVVAVADEVASAADLARDKDAGVPAAVVRGLGRYVTEDDGPGAAPLRRAAAEDLFR